MTAADVLRKAVEMEEYGRLTYLAQAEKASNPLIKALFLELSKDEERHRDWFQALLNDSPVNPDFADYVTESLENRMMAHFHRNPGEETTADTDEYEAALKIARDLEEASYQFYSELWEKEESESDKALFDLMRREEYSHLVGIENMLFYLTHTSQWLDKEESKRWNWIF